jgi:1-acyl-sn-glycerol-3-phosphate acyltransferase
MATLRAIVRLFLYALWCLAWIPVQWIVLRFTRGPGSLIIPLYWHRAVCRLFNIRVEIEGEPVRGRQVILTSNHVSYLDIEVFSTVTPWSFVAKAEVANWPLFGTLARLQQTAFTSRSRTDAHKDKNALSNMLAEGKNLIIFPEGTSSDGGQVLPFKSSLLSAALEPVPGRTLLVQPVTLAILEVDGRPADTGTVRDLYAWHGDMTLAPHLWAFAKSKGTRIRLVFHPPVDPATVTDRKALAALCHRAVAGGLDKVFSARGWRSAADTAIFPVQSPKESNDVVFVPGSQPPANLPAEQIRQ